MSGNNITIIENQQGVSILELLIVISVIVILATVALTNYRGQVAKAHDGRRKDDLAKLKIVMEDYYAGHNCYPRTDQMPSDCRSLGGLAGYLTEMICEPGGSDLYDYQPEGGSCPQYYRLYTNLEYTADPAIEQVGCAGGCPNATGTYNYGVCSENVGL